MQDEKRTDIPGEQGNVANENIGDNRVGQPNVYTVGANTSSAQSGEQSSYAPPTGNSVNQGEYSYSPREHIPEYRYDYRPYATTPPPVKPTAKKSRGGKTAIIVLAAVVIVLVMMLACVSAVLAVSLFKFNIDIGTTHIEGGNIDNNNPADTSAVENILPETQAPSEDAIIIKNPDSVTVQTVGGKIGDETLTIPDVVALVKNSVVEIYTEIPTYNGRFVDSGAGSGVVIGKSENGKTAYIITNNHVISGAQTITVRFNNGEEFKAKLCGTDSNTDVAVVSIDAPENITVAELGSSAGLVVGEGVVAIGNPLGELGGTVTNGIVSALAREVEIDGQAMTLLQTNAAVNPGNSGGGLFNMKGELIGVVNAKSGGDNVENIGFAIPIDTAYDIACELITHGYVTGRVDLGLSLVDVTDTYTAWYYGVSSLGVYVYESKYSTEIEAGDRIVSVNGTDVATSADIKSIISECNVGDVVTVRISRRGKQTDIQLTLREYVPTLNGGN